VLGHPPLQWAVKSLPVRRKLADPSQRKCNPAGRLSYRQASVNEKHRSILRLRRAYESL